MPLPTLPNPVGEYARQAFPTGVAADAVVTREAPINPCHPDYGCMGNGTQDETQGLVAAFARARTANLIGSVGEIYIPAGRFDISGPIPDPGTNGLKAFGAGFGTYIRQNADNTPIFAITAAAGCSDQIWQDMRLGWLNQQNGTAHPNSSVFHLLNSNVNGFYASRYENLVCWSGAHVWTFGPIGGPTGVAFWNNHGVNVHCSSFGGSLINNINTAGVGGPPNQFDRLTHIGGTVAPVGFALNLGGGHKWNFGTLDIEDWFDTLISCTGGGGVSIRDFHVERHHLYFGNGGGVVFNIQNSMFNVDNWDMQYYRNGVGAYSVFRVYGGSQARIGPGKVNTYATDTTAINPGGSNVGTIRLFFSDLDSPTEIGPRSILDPANVVDWLKTSEAGSHAAGIVADSGGPVLYDSTNALPAASAAYRGRVLCVTGKDAATADQYVMCMQSATGTYSWKVIATG